MDYPLAVIAREIDSDGVTFTICYCGQLFDDSVLTSCFVLFKSCSDKSQKNLEQPVVNLEFLGPNQLFQLDQWNATDADFPPTKTLHQIFEDVAAISQQKAAVIYEDVQHTYRELNERANKLAHYLRSLGNIKLDSLIALFLDKSEHMIISILAVCKSGAAYVPIDPSYPRDGIQYMFRDTEADVVIANQRYTSILRELFQGTMDIMEIESAIRLTFNFDSCNPQPMALSTDLAYVIYTSGTTGKPQGVMIEHRGVVNLQVSLANIFLLQARDDEVILSFSNYVFDHFVE